MPKEAKEGGGEFCPFLEVDNGSDACCCQKALASWRVCRALGVWGLYLVRRYQNGTEVLEESYSNRLADLVVVAVISDPNDPKFDLEAYLTLSEAK